MQIIHIQSGIMTDEKPAIAAKLVSEGRAEYYDEPQAFDMLLMALAPSDPRKRLAGLLALNAAAGEV